MINYGSYSGKYSCFLYRHEMLERDMQEICAYGLELLISTLIEVINVIFVSVLAHKIIFGIIYIICIMTIRTYTGGYHAATKLRCNIIFIIVYILSLIFMQWIQKINNYNLILWCGLIASYIYVIYNAPIENHNKPLNQCQINKNRKSSILIYGIFMMLGIIYDISGMAIGIVKNLNCYSVYIKIILIFIVIAMIVGKYKERCFHRMAIM